MWRNGLSDNTLEVFDKVSQLEPKDFDIMQPKYNVSSEEMADYFMEVVASRKK